MLLVDRADSGRFRQDDLAAVRRQVAQDQPEQRRFADAVASDQADLGPDREHDAGAIEETAAPAVENEIIDLKHAGALMVWLCAIAGELAGGRHWNPM